MEVRRGLAHDFIRDQNDYFLLQQLGSWLPSSNLPYGSRCPQGPHWVVRGGLPLNQLSYSCSRTTFSLVFCNIDTWPHLHIRTARKYNTSCLAAVFPTRYQFSYILEHGVGNLWHSDLLPCCFFSSGGDHLRYGHGEKPGCWFYQGLEFCQMNCKK